MSKESNAVAFDSRIIIENLKSNWLNILIVIAAVIIIVLIIKLVSRKIKKTLDTKISPEKAEMCIRDRIIQSSSATSVMTVGFVNAGLISLKTAIGIITVSYTHLGYYYYIKNNSYHCQHHYCNNLNRSQSFEAFEIIPSHIRSILEL